MVLDPLRCLRHAVPGELLETDRYQQLELSFFEWNDEMVMTKGVTSHPSF
jgi:hypothetical protein